MNPSRLSNLKHSTNLNPSTLKYRPLQQTLINFFSSNKEGYQSIGSFHSENPDELIRLPTNAYTPPELPFPNEAHEPIKSISVSSAPFINCSIHQQAYPHLHRGEWTFLNHGAFGAALDIGIQRAHSWRNFLEEQPLRYFDRYLLDHLVYSARCMVDFCTDGEEKRDKLREGVALIPNVTSGMNAVIGGHARCSAGRQAEERFGNKVFYYDTAYGSNKKMCQIYHGKHNAIAISFEEDFLPLLQRLNYTTSREDSDWNTAAAEIFIKALDATIQKEIANGTLSKSSLSGSLLILDHITSNTAIHTPISSIAKHAKKEYGMIVAVDGAHGLLGLNLDMTRVLSSGDDKTVFSGYVDVYITNAHKWFSSPRGAAVMFCANPHIRESILRQPAVVSHGVDDGYLSRFLWDGCRDYAAQLSLPPVAEYWSKLDVNNLRAEMGRNLLEGVRILISRWHPGVCGGRGDDADASCVLKHSAEAGLTLVPMGVHAPMMALVRLPLSVSGGSEGCLEAQSLTNEQTNSTDAKKVQDFLYSQKVEVPVKCIRGVLYVRVSCHLYNSAQEFETLANALLKYR